MMFHLTQSDWHLIWFIAKLSLPLLVGWGLDRLIRLRNPRLRVVLWRTVSVAVCLELLALNLPRLGHVPVSWNSSAAETDRMTKLVATPSDSEFSPAAPEAIAWSASMNLEPEEALQPQHLAKAVDLAERRDRRLGEVDASQPSLESHSSLQPQQARVGSLVTATGGNTNRGIIGLFILIYMSVVVCLFFREIAAKLRALEIIKRSDPFESDVSETFARQLNIANVPVRTSDEIGSPCVVGWRRPVVLLPQVLSCEDAKSAIAHEFAHIASRDVHWDAFLRLICAVLWFHPLAWKMVSGHRMACESVSDLTAAQLINDRNSYRCSLARIALNLRSAASRRELHARTLAMARRPEIIDRLRIIASEIQLRPISRSIRSLAILSVVGVAILGTCSLDFVPANVGAQAPSATEALEAAVGADFTAKPGTFHVQAIGENGTPLAGARFELVVCTDTCRSQTIVADERGRMILEVPVGFEKCSVWGLAYSPGFMPGYFNVENIDHKAAPMSTVILMKPGIVTQGIVLDEEGEPVAGAHVNATVMTDVQFGYSIFSQTTDEDGRWTMDSIAGEVPVDVSHDEYVNDSLLVLPGSDSVIRLSRGRTIKLRVVDPAGNPVPNARVEIDQAGIGIHQLMVTDPQGRFQRGGLPVMDQSIQVCAEGFSPIIHHVPDGYQGEEMTIRLREGKIFEMLVVDAQNRPISDAQIRVRGREGFRELWTGSTDASGVATWRGATGEAEQVSIGAKGFVSSDREIYTSQAIKLVLARAGMMRGSVVDKVSGDRVEEFSVRLARIESLDQFFRSDAQMTGREGHFELPISFEVENLVAIIEADGFNAWSRPLDQISLDQLIEVQLERAKALAGWIVSPGGNPVANATVVLTDPSLLFPIPIHGKANFNEPRTFRPQKAQTDIYGKFRFWLDGELPENLVFFVEHEEGFAHVKLNALDEDHRVHIEPWTSLEVIAIRDEKPVAGLSVELRYIDYGPKDGRVSIRPQTYVTDHDGHVRFDKVRPWEAQIITKFAESNVAIGRENIEHPAETTKRITLLPTPNTVTLTNDGVRLEAHIDIPPDPLGTRIPKFDESGSISGQSLSGEPQQFQFKANSDGRFMIESIPPGHYQINVQVGIQVPEGHSGGWMGVGALSDSFEVPVDASRVHSVTFTQSWPKTLTIGDDAVPLVGQLAKGGQVSSRELAGKWLLLDCYSPKSSSYREQLAKIISAYPQWHDAGLEMLSVSLDWQLRDLKSQIELSDGWKQLPWAIISDHQSSSQICEDYQLRSSPMRLLIDPSGKIAYRGDDWDTLERTIDTALVSDVAPNRTSRFAGLRSQPFGDVATPSLPAAIAAIESRSVSEGEVANVASRQFSQRLQLISAQGTLLRSIDLGVSKQDVPMRRLVVDRKRERLYAIRESSLLAVSRTGQELFEIPIAGLRSIGIDDETGEVWCVCGSSSSGSTVILDVDGNEVRRLPLAPQGIVINPAQNGCWVVGREVSFVSRKGTQIRNEPEIKDALFLMSSLVDQRGRVWMICMDRPSHAEGARTALWRETESGMKIVAPYDAVFSTKNMSITKDAKIAFKIEAVGGEVIVQSHTDMPVSGEKPNLHQQRLSLDGEPLGEIGTNLGSIAASDAELWSIHDNVLRRYSSGYVEVATFKIGEPVNESTQQGPKFGTIVAFE